MNFLMMLEKMSSCLFQTRAHFRLFPVFLFVLQHGETQRVQNTTAHIVLDTQHPCPTQ